MLLIQLSKNHYLKRPFHIIFGENQSTIDVFICGLSILFHWFICVSYGSTTLTWLLYSASVKILVSYEWFSLATYMIISLSFRSFIICLGIYLFVLIFIFSSMLWQVLFVCMFVCLFVCINFHFLIVHSTSLSRAHAQPENECGPLNAQLHDGAFQSP